MVKFVDPDSGFAPLLERGWN